MKQSLFWGEGWTLLDAENGNFFHKKRIISLVLIEKVEKTRKN
tara:strand:+ start:23 stop:151 length:129 start_codon:yes stop_codon:yes gene_type:complete